MLQPYQVDDFAFRQTVSLPCDVLKSEGYTPRAMTPIGSFKISRHNQPSAPILLRFYSPRSETRIFSAMLPADRVDDFVACLQDLSAALHNASEAAATIPHEE
jgi:hypothetical protein